MNVPTESERQRAVAMLESDTGHEDTDLLHRLESSESLRCFLENTAASADEWDRIRQHLRPTEFDRASRAGFSAATLAGADAAEPVAIAEVLDVLSPTDAPHHLGRLGTYEITGVVGIGGMGVVLKAVDPSLDRVVAVKVMAPALANNDKARRRFAREAKAAAAVLHPNVVPIHSVSSDDSVPYLVMAYIRGGSLQKRLEAAGPLPVVEILRIGAQIAAGLAAAHEQGLVHRDIKPENILLEEGVERVTITDFGLARAVDDNTVTQNGAIAGTPMYMSPEQAAGQPLDQQSDLFSLGSVLFALCTGQPPYTADSSWGVMRQIIDDTPPELTEVNADIPVWLSGIVRKLMARDKAERFASAAEVRDLLEACLSHVQQPETTPLPPVPAVNAAGTATTPGRYRRTGRRGRLMAAAAAGLCLCAALLWSSQRQAQWRAFEQLQTFLETGVYDEHPLNQIDTLLAGGSLGHDYLKQLDTAHQNIVFASGEFLDGQQTVAGIVTDGPEGPQLDFRFVSPQQQGGSTSSFPAGLKVQDITIDDGPNYRRNVQYTVVVARHESQLADRFHLQSGAVYRVNVPLTDRLDSQIDWNAVWTAAVAVAPASGLADEGDPQAGDRADDVALFDVVVNGRGGFINSDGEIVIAPTYQKVYPFTEGLAAVQVNSLWGYINTKGNMVIEPRFISAGLFASGRAVVQLDSFEDQFGYIDTKGRLVIKPQFDRAERFVNGIARVGNATTAGKLLSRIADVGVETDERYIDVTGREVPKPAPQYAGTGAPNELIPFSAGDKMGYVNADGKTVIAPRFHSCGPFVDGLALACEDTQFGYIDRTGKFVIPPRFQYANDFADGLAGVQLAEGKWGFIDGRGNTVIEPKFDWIYGGFQEGIAQVTVAGRLGYVNKRGDWVW